MLLADIQSDVWYNFCMHSCKGENLMKSLFKIFLACVAVLLSAGTSVSAANADADVVAALQSGNSAAIASAMNQNVHMRVTGTDNVYSKTQAEKIMQMFFSQHKPVKFMAGSNTAGKDSKTVQGTLHTSNGDFKVYILLKHSNTTYFINQIRIENGTD